MAGKPAKFKELERHWLSIAKRWQASGLSQGAFCRKEGIVLTTFYAWRSKLEKRKLLPAVAPVSAEPVCVEESKPHEKFVPLEVKPVQSQFAIGDGAGRLEIVTPGGYIVRIP